MVEEVQLELGCIFFYSDMVSSKRIGNNIY